jgi:hypothetical protein
VRELLCIERGGQVRDCLSFESGLVKYRHLNTWWDFGIKAMPKFLTLTCGLEMPCISFNYRFQQVCLCGEPNMPSRFEDDDFLKFGKLHLN